MTALAPSPERSRPPTEAMLVANGAEGHVGYHWRQAAGELGLNFEWMEAAEAWRGPAWWRRWCWHVLGRRPPGLLRFECELLAKCRRLRPRLLLVSGITPPRARLLRELSVMGIKTANFLTDHPLNPAHRSAWFLRALPEYSVVFSPRRAMESELKHRLHCQRVENSCFAYNPAVHHSPTQDDIRAFTRHVAAAAVFIGAADEDRVRWLRGLPAAGLPVALWGGYWQRHAELAAHSQGMADASTCRAAVLQAGINLGLVRDANEDDHSMRSFEMPAVGGLLAMRHSSLHRQLFGAHGEAVFYFSTPDELVEACQLGLGLPLAKRLEMKQRCHAAVVRGRHRYVDRLSDMLSMLRDVAT